MHVLVWILASAILTARMYESLSSKLVDFFCLLPYAPLTCIYERAKWRWGSAVRPFIAGMIESKKHLI